MLTELEKTMRAKMYIDKLAEGIDPLTDTSLPDGDIINNVRISRCLSYVSDILRQVIENGGSVGKKIIVRANGIPFQITPEQLAAIERTETPVGVLIIAKRISAVLDEGMKGIPAVKISNWCLEQGLLTEETVSGRKRKVSTAKGNQLGIITIDSVSPEGVPYKKNIYDINAQEYILAHLEDIAQFE